MKDKAVVLLSSGLDSTVNLYEAHQQLEVCLVLSFRYGQRAEKPEMRQSQIIANKLGLKHKIIDLTFMKNFGLSSLIDDSKKIPTSEVQIDDMKTSLETAKSVWVPNRNGIFLNIAAGFAESLGAKYVIPGFNLEEAQTFPDNSASFMSALDKSFSFSTSNHVQLKCYTIDMNKTQIVEQAKKIGIDFNDLWPCYFDGQSICRECESCKRFLRALNS